jgi:hypothetical protein
MKNILISAIALVAFVAVPSVASADANTEARSRAIQLCRTEVAARSGADADSVRLDQVRVRAGSIRVDFDLWSDGQLQNIRCDVDRSPELQIASITPPLGATAAVAR